MIPGFDKTARKAGRLSLIGQPSGCFLSKHRKQIHLAGFGQVLRGSFCVATLVLLESLATVIIPQLIYYMQEGNFIFCCLSRRHSFATVPLFEPIYNNPFLQPAFKNMMPALFGALLVPQIAKAPKQAVCPILLEGRRPDFRTRRRW